MLSVVEVCVDYGGVNVFHVSLDFGQCLWCSLCCMLFVSYAWVFCCVVM